MRVLHVIPSLLVGGAEKMLVELVAAQRAAGHEVEVYGLRSHATHLEQALSGTVPVTFAGVAGNYSLRGVARFLRFVRTRHYDVVHTHLTPGQVLGFMAAPLLRIRGSVLVTTEHNTVNSRRGRAVLRPLDALLYRAYRAIICISQGTADELGAWLPSTRAKVEVIPNGIVLERYARTTRRPFDTPRPNLISVARLEPQKDQDTLIRALAAYGRGTLRLVGGGRREAELRELCARLGVQDRVLFLGVRDDVPELLARSDVYVQSSHWEGFGLAAAEAMAAGLPTLASDLPGLREVVGGAGLLFPPGDAAALADALRALDDPATSTRVARACQERAADFSLDRMVAAYTALYERMRRKARHPTAP